MTSEEPKFDVAIIGGGPAGMAAALWCADLGLSCVLLEKSDKLGGQLHNIHNRITNYPGLVAETGKEMVERFRSSLAGDSFEQRLRADAASINAKRMSVTLTSGRELEARAVIIATGVRRRKLGVAGEDEFAGRGILRSGAGERDVTRGKHVVIIGGGDAAMENAVILSEVAARVTVVHRRKEFSSRPEFLERATDRDNVTLLRGFNVSRIEGSDRVERVHLVDPAGRSSSIDADYVLIRIGVQPNSDFLIGEIDLMPDGYVAVDNLWRTNRAGVYAIGDVACPLSPTISTAAGSAATAAKAVAALINRGSAL